MLTRKFAKKYINDFLDELSSLGYNPAKAILFGSVAKNCTHHYSDIDLAVWDSRFTGCKAEDYEPIVRLLSKFYKIELHTFPLGETEHENPFISEVIKWGVIV